MQPDIKPRKERRAPHAARPSSQCPPFTVRNQVEEFEEFFRKADKQLQIRKSMGATQSAIHSHPPSRALHILRVTPTSPASQTNIEPFFDFVVGFEGDTLSSGVDVSELEKIVEDHEGKVLNLLVWNSKQQGTRGNAECSLLARSLTAF